MAVLRYPDDSLRRVCVKVPRIDAAVRKDAALLFAELRRMDSPLLVVNGLAANQIGLTCRIVAFKSWGSYAALCNPEIVSSYVSMPSLEMCASIPGRVCLQVRKCVVKVRFLGLDGKSHYLRLIGMAAFTMQHELDHLDGRLIIDGHSR